MSQLPISLNASEALQFLSLWYQQFDFRVAENFLAS